MKDIASFVKGYSWIGISQVLINIKGLILLPILISTIGISAYGVYTLIISMVSFLFVVTSLGVGFRYKRYMPGLEDRSKRVSMFYEQFFFHASVIVVVAFLLVFLDEYLRRYFFKGSEGYSVYLVSAFLLLYFLSYQVGSFFRLTQRMKYFTLTQAGVPYLEITLIYFAALLLGDLSIDLIIVANIVALVLVSFPLWAKLFNEIGFVIPSWNTEKLLEDIRFGFPLLVSFIVEFILSTSDRYIIAFYMTTREVGYYSPAYALGSLVKFVPQLYIFAMPVFLAKLIDHGKMKEAKSMITLSVNFFLLCAVWYCGFTVLFGGDILTAITNEEVSDNASFVMPIIALSMVFYGLNVVMGEILFIVLRTKAILLGNLIGATLNAILNVVLIYYVRDVAIAAITTLAGYAAAFFVLHMSSRKAQLINYDLAFLMKIIVVTALDGLMTFFLVSLLPETRGFVILEGLFSLVMFVVLMFVFGVLSKEKMLDVAAMARLVIR